MCFILNLTDSHGLTPNTAKAVCIGSRDSKLVSVERMTVNELACGEFCDERFVFCVDLFVFS